MSRSPSLLIAGCGDIGSRLALQMLLADQVRGEQLLAAARVAIAVINRNGRPRRLPDDLRKLLLG